MVCVLKFEKVCLGNIFKEGKLNTIQVGISYNEGLGNSRCAKIINYSLK